MKKNTILKNIEKEAILGYVRSGILKKVSPEDIDRALLRDALEKLGATEEDLDKLCELCDKPVEGEKKEESKPLSVMGYFRVMYPSYLVEAALILAFCYWFNMY